MGILLAIFTAILWALFDVVRKKSLLFLTEVKVLLWIVVSQFIFFLIFLYFSEFDLVLKDYFLYAIFLILLNLVSLYLFLSVLKTGELSTYIPLLSFTPLFSAVYANIILGESLNYLQYVGIFFIIMGAYLLYVNKFSSFKKKKFNLLRNKNFFMVIIVALIWSLTPVLDKECMKYTDIYLHGFIQSLGMLLFFPLIFIKQITLKSLSLHKKIRVNFFILALVVIGFLSTFFQLFTLNHIFVAELEALKRSIGIILSLIFGYYIFKEKISLIKVLAVFIILLGVTNIIIFT
jgi:drug/metabolite transporter (DMT)-like permease